MNIASFQPLLPEGPALEALLEKASLLTTRARELLALSRSPVRSALAPLLRSMNAYYSNKIEGQHTTPTSIEHALRNEWSSDQNDYKKQLIAVAHVGAELLLDDEWRTLPAHELFDPQKIKRIHQLLFEGVPEALRLTDEGVPIDPGVIRDKQLQVGGHVAPPVDLMQCMMQEWAVSYQQVKGVEHQTIATACSHHRLAWVHPFIDGNGRVCRLHSHLMLQAVGLTDGLWSPSRGFARTQGEYYRRLAAADRKRHNDLDGRGGLSEEELVKFVHYFLDCCLDQVDYMLRMMDYEGFRTRLRDLLLYLEMNPWDMGSESSVIKYKKTVLALEMVASLRPISRAEFAQIVGESEATTRRIIRSLLSFGILQSSSHKGDLSLALPLKSLHILFPRLWPEVDTSLTR